MNNQSAVLNPNIYPLIRPAVARREWRYMAPGQLFLKALDASSTIPISW